MYTAEAVQSSSPSWIAQIICRDASDVADIYAVDPRAAQLAGLSTGGMPIPTGFLSNDVLTAHVWGGQTQAPLFSPTVSWNSYVVGLVNISIASSQIMGLDADGAYRLQVIAARGTPPNAVPVVVIDWELRILPSPGSAGQPTLTYCTYQDMLNVASWISRVQNLDVDQEGFYTQRLEARNWMDWLVINNFRPSFIGNFGAHSTAAFGFGYVGYSRSLLPSPTVVGYLASNFLIVRPQIVKACAHWACSLKGLGQVGSNNQLYGYGMLHRDFALREVTGIVAELDLNGDGIGEIGVPLSSTNTLSV